MFPHIGDVDATQKAIDAWAQKWFPNADKAEHKAHATVLYHGPGNATKLKDAGIEAKHAGRNMTGQVRAIERYTVETDKGTRHFVTLAFDCESLQDLHAAMRAEAEALSGEKSWQKPHTGPQGQMNYYKHNVNPHITLAVYSDANSDKFEKDWKHMITNSAASSFTGMPVVLGDVEAHYSG